MAAAAASSSSSSSPVPIAASTPSKVRNKKRPTSPGNSGNATAKKKKLGQNVVLDTIGENKNVAADSSPGHGEPAVKPLKFKDPNFVHSGIGGAGVGKKNRVWKNLKQILATERMLPWKLNDPNYCNIDAPPSFKPAKKYSDISGLPANYTDPQSKLRFSSTEEFSYIRMLPSDIVTGYLALRKATSIVP
ncbi:INO80 complex subunit C isoform X1 [Leucoraja erinacea]|uniref:INO80 complex subunit C isoform X1 n=1 Tax=Leucoraja erinaceus TaxID=7782 RepID=UPI0024567F9A|nr:INO80 complex subunit C isoform X1 [Leucoraja erinacea]